MTTANMVGLSPELIANLMGKSRTKNAYGPKVLEFADSDEAAINPKEVWAVELGQKNPATLYQGFNNAINKAGLKDTIALRRDGEDVFLLHTERVNLAIAELTASASANGSK